MQPFALPLATALLGLTTAVHLWAGGPEYHAPLRTLLTDPFFASMISVLWHAVTVFLAIATLACLWLIRAPNPALSLCLSAIMAGWAGLFLYFGVSDLGTIWIMPQWTIFLALPALLIWGHKRA